MNAATRIRAAVGRVSLLRTEQRTQSALHAAVERTKALQARRFAGTYADALASGPYAAAVRFFLVELYSDKDFSERDAQFARIAGAIEKLFPAQVAETAVSLAQLHALTEELDHAVASAWLGLPPGLGEVPAYVQAWRAVGRRDERQAQLQAVLAIGDEMVRLTRKPGLRTMLRMMRGPAAAAGLGALQRFLETGFDTFAAMSRNGVAAGFLHLIADREQALIGSMFDAPLVACETGLARILGEAP
ncbi:hypothetical protein GCM10027034_39840 [Ramlibacter solisilvae]|uniref:DUF8198 domain-containing protein n=1 Tax=Ramlibacter tataouinensis TaxID=94132 RepID=A0A127JU49_9BURK|nr:hypothetical protein [Ramlibacter tataouinensis]AMO23506.1 hypothetical protein UC35_12150 [Ramlibacter tataouinensis]